MFQRPRSLPLQVTCKCKLPRPRLWRAKRTYGCDRHSSCRAGLEAPIKKESGEDRDAEETLKSFMRKLLLASAGERMELSTAEQSTVRDANRLHG